MSQKQEHPARNWIFTLNNYTPQDYHQLSTTECTYLIIGKEVGQNGTPHLQGYIQFKKKLRLTALKKINQKAHWEKARGTPQENKDYCSKEGDFIEKGVMSIERKRKLDMVEAVFETLNGAYTEDLIIKHGAGYIMNKQKIDFCVREIKSQRHYKSELEEMQSVELWDWQKEALDKLLNQDRRKILFVVDFKGNKGKTYFSKWLVFMKGAMRFDNGRSIDIKHAYDGQPIVVFDLVRSSLEHTNWEAIEQIKNGIIFCSKYVSTLKSFKPPSVAVFMNHMPDRTRLSSDRYDIMEI